MKKTILPLMLLGTCLLQAMETEKLQEKFNFDGLPHKVQNQVVEQTWADVDWLEKNLKKLDLSAFDATHRIEIAKPILYNFHKKILFYTLNNGRPCISTIGNIRDHALEHAQAFLATNLGSLSYSFDRFSAELVIPQQNKHLSIILKDKKNLSSVKLAEVKSACFSVLGHIAITWQASNDEYFVTILTLKNIEEKKEWDLFQDAIPLGKLHSNNNSCQLKATGSLFTLDGSKLVTCFKEEDTTPGEGSGRIIYDFFDITCDRPLTTAEKAKRLCIATVGAKNLLKDRLQQK